MIDKSALFSLGFRPFFLLASFLAFVALTLWALVFALGLQLSAFDYYPMIIWHAHEMIFAYAMAVIAGFLLTAIKNWTKIQTVNGSVLLVLSLSWILARIAPFLLDTAWLIALIDMLFLPLLAYFIAIPLLKAANRRNYFMIVLVLVFALLNLCIHLYLLGFIQLSVVLVYQSAFYLIIALIIVMAGRVFPMFSQNGVEFRYQVVNYAIIEKLILPSYFLFALALLFVSFEPLVVAASIFALIVHGIRLKGWYNKQIWSVPLVWVLHVGYGFLLLGFGLSAVGVFYPFVSNLALHAFSVGTLGIITIGMMARVSVGHTGRNLKFPPKILKIVFIFMVIATLIRVFLPIIANNSNYAIVLSAGFWVVAFLLFFINYLPIWLQPRVDL